MILQNYVDTMTRINIRSRLYTKSAKLIYFKTRSLPNYDFTKSFTLYQISHKKNRYMKQRDHWWYKSSYKFGSLFNRYLLCHSNIIKSRLLPSAPKMSYSTPRAKHKCNYAFSRPYEILHISRPSPGEVE